MWDSPASLARLRITASRSLGDPLASSDNCGKSRNVDCGACGGSDVCVANACKAPACSSLAFAHQATITGLSDVGQDALAGEAQEPREELGVIGECRREQFERDE